MSNAPAPIKQEVEAQILHQKTERIMARQEAERLSYLQDNLKPEQLQKLEAFWDDEQKHRHDLLRPEPGPHHDLHSHSELEQAKQRVVEDYERNR